jgi:uncharacterized protein (TIGR02145 family)
MKTKAFPLLFLLSAAPFAISFSQSTCPGGYVEDGDEIPCGLGNPCCTIEFACNGPNSVCNNYDWDFESTGGCDLSCTAGCLDPEANNFDAGADFDDGTCDYPPVNIDLCSLPYNPDSNCDSLINFADLLDFLPLYGTEFIAEAPSDDETETAEFTCGQPIEFAGVSYSTALIGGDCWFSDDLRTTELADGTPLVYFSDSSNFENTYVLYNDALADTSQHLYPEAVAVENAICPNGWRVSNGSDWQEFLLGFNFSDDVDYFLKSTDWGGSNILHFNARPNGVRNVSELIPEGYLNLFENENSANHIGKYLENFNDGVAQGWSYEGPVTSLSLNGEYELFYYLDCSWGGSNCAHTNTIFSPIFQFNASESPIDVSFNIDVEWSSDCDYDYALYAQLDESGEWILLDSESCDFQGFRNYDLSSYVASTIQFKWVNTYHEWSRLTLDNFTLISSIYPGVDTPFLDDLFFGEGYLGRWWSIEETTNSAQMTSEQSGLEFLNVNPMYFQSIRCVRED